MFSKSFVKFLIKYQDKQVVKKESIEVLEFKPVKVSQAAKVVIAAIKDSY